MSKKTSSKKKSTKTKTKSAKKPAAKAAKAKSAPGVAKGGFYQGRRGARGKWRVALHIMISTELRKKLQELSHSRGCTGSEVIRGLLARA